MRVYPRVCGGTAANQTIELAEGGLSPRVRGNRRPCGVHLPVEGSIPACAGEPRTELRKILRIGVYPRVCGGTVNAVPGATMLIFPL